MIDVTYWVYKSVKAVVSIVAAAFGGRRSTGALACVVTAIAGGCAGEAIDPGGLPERVDVRSLRGRLLPETSCRFDRNDQVSGGDRRIWLRCDETKEGRPIGFVEVSSVLSGYEPREDSVSCAGDPRSPSAHFCDTRHGMTIVDTRAVCHPDRCNSEEEARKLMARIVEFLATLPE